MSKPKMMTITGPSCSGKTHLINSLVNMEKSNVRLLIGDTTRLPREGERGDEYRFVSEKDFLNDRDSYAQTVRYQNVYYGTRTVDIVNLFNEGFCPVRIVEPTGVPQFKRICNDLGAEVVSIYVDQDAEVLIARWLERYKAESNPDTNYFSERIIQTLSEEIVWKDNGEYDFYYDTRFQQEIELNYALVRIAAGGISLPVVRTISPRSI